MTHFRVFLNTSLTKQNLLTGITNFDLLGDFGEIEWLGSFTFVLLYNVSPIYLIPFLLITEMFHLTQNRLFLQQLLD